MLFIDSADPVAIREMCEIGIVCGVTTNPVLLPRSPVISENFALRDVVKAITAHPEWKEEYPIRIPIFVQLVSESSQGMLEEALELHKISKDLMFKIPFSPQGLRAISLLNDAHLMVNITSVMSAQQACLAAHAGADYVSLFYGRIADGGNDPRTTLASTRRLFDIHDLSGQIIAGSLRAVGDVMSALSSGAHIATVKPEILDKMMVHPLTAQVNEEFRQATLKNNALYEK